MFEVVDPPEGWEYEINSEFFLGTSVLDEDPTGIVNFMVKYPTDSRYVNKTGNFNISVQTMAAGHPEIPPDDSTILQFTVRCIKSVPKIR